MTDTPTIQCPSCHGEKTVMAFVDYAGRPGEVRMVNCPTCEGEGTITQEQARWRDMGKRIREQRRKQRLTLQQRAAQLRIGLVKLSQAESGKIDPSPYGFAEATE